MVRATLRVYEGIDAFFPIEQQDSHIDSIDLRSSLSQLVTLPFQSQVCLSKSKASPLGHVIFFRPDLVHLVRVVIEKQKTKSAYVSLRREKDVQFSLTLKLIAVLHVCLPVAGLSFDVERETGRTSHRGQSGYTDFGGFVTPKIILISKFC